MARPVRDEAAGPVYHVMARGDGGLVVFEDDEDRKAWIGGLGKACAAHGWRVHARGVAERLSMDHEGNVTQAILRGGWRRDSRRC